MKIRVFDLLFCLLFFLLSFSPLNAALLSTSISELTKSADGIVTGEVVKIESQWDVENKTIFTYVMIKVDQVLKNDSSKKKLDRITLRLSGGTVWLATIHDFDMPEFSLYDKVFLFLSTDTGINPPSSKGDRLGDFIVRGWEMGKFTINDKMIDIKDGKNNIHGRMLLEDFIKDIEMILSGSEAPPSFLSPQNLR